MMMTVIGPSGSGKSYFVSRFIERLSKKKFVVIVDDTDYYHNELNTSTVLIEVDKTNYNKFDFLQIFRDAIKVGASVVFECVDLLSDEQRQFVENLGGVLASKMKRVTLVIDEAYQFFPKFHYPESIGRLMRGGRKRAIDVILIYQQFGDVDLLTPRQSNYLVAFKVSEPNERDRLRKMLGYDFIKDLKEHDFVIKNLRTGEYAIGNAKDIDWLSLD